MNAKTLISKIEKSGRKARRYSGRGMFGKQCVGVSLDRYDVGDGLPKGGVQDSLGLGTIRYWPGVAWPEGVEES